MPIWAKHLVFLAGPLLLGVPVAAWARRRSREGTAAAAWAVLGLSLASVTVPLTVISGSEQHLSAVAAYREFLLKGVPEAALGALLSFWTTEVIVACGLWAVVMGLVARLRDTGRLQRVLGTASLCVGAVVLVSAGAPYVSHRLWLRNMVAEARAGAVAHPDDCSARDAYGGWLLRLGRLDEALVEAQAARRLDESGDPHYALTVGVIYIRMGQPDRALEPLEWAYRRRARYQEVAAATIAKMESGRPPEFRRLPDHQRWVESMRHAFDERLVTVSHWYARCLIALGRLQEAERVMAAAALQFPTHWDARIWLARVHRALGEEQKLQEDIQALRDAYPEHSEALDQWVEGLPPPEETRAALEAWARKAEDG